MLPADRPALFLAPMQDVTDLPFLRTMAAFGGADVYVTEYFRVHIHSRIEPYILRSITENPTDRPIIAQMIGQDADELVRTALELKNTPSPASISTSAAPPPSSIARMPAAAYCESPTKLTPSSVASAKPAENSPSP